MTTTRAPADAAEPSTPQKPSSPAGVYGYAASDVIGRALLRTAVFPLICVVVATLTAPICKPSCLSSRLHPRARLPPAPLLPTQRREDARSTARPLYWPELRHRLLDFITLHVHSDAAGNAAFNAHLAGPIEGCGWLPSWTTAEDVWFALGLSGTLACIYTIENGFFAVREI